MCTCGKQFPTIPSQYNGRTSYVFWTDMMELYMWQAGLKILFNRLKNFCYKGWRQMNIESFWRQFLQIEEKTFHSSSTFTHFLTTTDNTGYHINKLLTTTTFFKMRTRSRALSKWTSWNYSKVTLRLGQLSLSNSIFTIPIFFESEKYTKFFVCKASQAEGKFRF